MHSDIPCAQLACSTAWSASQFTAIWVALISYKEIVLGMDEIMLGTDDIVVSMEGRLNDRLID